MRERAIQFTS